MGCFWMGLSLSLVRAIPQPSVVAFLGSHQCGAVSDGSLPDHGFRDPVLLVTEGGSCMGGGGGGVLPG